MLRREKGGRPPGPMLKLRSRDREEILSCIPHDSGTSSYVNTWSLFNTPTTPQHADKQPDRARHADATGDSDCASDPSSMADFRIFTSLRYDALLLESAENAELSGYSGVSCPLYMLCYHRDRLIDAATNFDWTAVVSRLRGPNGLRWLQDEILRQLDAGQHQADLSAPSKVGLPTLLFLLEPHD